MEARVRSALLVVAFALGCFGDPPEASELGDGTEAPTGDATTDTTLGEGEATTHDETAGESSTGDTPAVCGNGVVEPGEDCDDGDEVDGNGCNNDCQPSGRMLWMATFNGQANANDEGYAVAVDGQGAVIVTGVQRTMAGNADTWLRKYENTGDIAWVASSVPLPDQVPTGADFGDGLAIDPVDGVVVCGIFTSPAGGTDAWVRRYTTEGTLLWTRTVANPGTGYDHCEAVATTADGRIIAAGHQADETNVLRPWAVTFTLEGDIIETYALDLPGTAGYVFAILPIEDGFWITGHRVANPAEHALYAAQFSFGDSVAQQILSHGPFERLDSGRALVPSGSTVRAYGYADTEGSRLALSVDFADASEMLWRDLDLIEGAAVDPSGNLVIAGRTLPSVNGGDGYVAKLDPAGRTLWFNTHDGAIHGHDGFEDVAVGPAGEVAITGFETADGQGTNILVILYAP